MVNGTALQRKGNIFIVTVAVCGRMRQEVWLHKALTQALVHLPV